MVNLKSSLPKKICILLALTVVVGCSRKNDINYESYTAEEIYAAADSEFRNEKHKDAAFIFSEIERLYPYSEWAQQALLMAAVAHQAAGQYEDARNAAQRYLDFYPADINAAYAQYLIALSYYDQIDDVSRDQGVTLQALQALRVVVERYPESEYQAAALLKFDFALNHLAGKEMDVGRYYLKRGHFGSAIKRFRAVVEEYQTTSHTPEALHRLVEAYLSLGLDTDAQTAAAILGHNFRGTTWYKDSYTLLQAAGIDDDGVIDSGESRGTWLSEVYRRVLKGEWL